jgi:hypothetical protein
MELLGVYFTENYSILLLFYTKNTCLFFVFNQSDQCGSNKNTKK